MVDGDVVRIERSDLHLEDENGGGYEALGFFRAEQIRGELSPIVTGTSFDASA